MVSSERITLEKSLRLNFAATNNVAKYEVLLAGLNAVKKLGGKATKVFYDSRLMVSQV